MEKLLARLFESVLLTLCLLYRLRFYLNLGDFFIVNLHHICVSTLPPLSLVFLVKGHFLSHGGQLFHGLACCKLRCHCHNRLFGVYHVLLHAVQSSSFFFLLFGFLLRCDDDCSIFALLSVCGEVLAGDAYGCLGTARYLITPEVQDLWLFHLREDSERIVRL